MVHYFKNYEQVIIAQFTIASKRNTAEKCFRTQMLLKIWLCFYSRHLKPCFLTKNNHTMTWLSAVNFARWGTCVVNASFNRLRMTRKPCYINWIWKVKITAGYMWKQRWWCDATCFPVYHTYIGIRREVKNNILLFKNADCIRHYLQFLYFYSYSAHFYIIVSNGWKYVLNVGKVAIIL